MLKHFVENYFMHLNTLLNIVWPNVFLFFSTFMTNTFSTICRILQEKNCFCQINDFSLWFFFYIKGGGWKCHIKYKGQDWFISFLSMQQVFRFHLTAIASWQTYQATTVSWHLYISWLLRKEVKQSYPLYLI